MRESVTDVPTLDESQAFLCEHYSQQLTPQGELANTHAAHVAKLVRRIAAEVYLNPAAAAFADGLGRVVAADAADKVRRLEHAALLHEAIERTGATIETIRDLVDMPTAELVAEITLDTRLPCMERHSLRRNRLQYAGQDLTMLALADMIATAQSVRNRLQVSHTAESDIAVYRWAETLYDDLVAMSQLSHHEQLRRYAEKLRSGLQELQQDASAKHAARSRHNRLLKNIATRKETPRGKRSAPNAVVRVQPRTNARRGEGRRASGGG